MLAADNRKANEPYIPYAGKEGGKIPPQRRSTDNTVVEGGTLAIVVTACST